MSCIDIQLVNNQVPLVLLSDAAGKFHIEVEITYTF